MQKKTKLLTRKALAALRKKQGATLLFKAFMHYDAKGYTRKVKRKNGSP
ncbi:hypothetical protein AGMMS49949_09180 [Alphaproteobacteria bacterium]|nr:hypothetical protein AGMMS49949_09180 [Alphaproteobacteria bacterium]